MVTRSSAGPLLRSLLDAQRHDEEASGWPLLEGCAAGLVALSQRLNRPITWPVGDSAQRLLGAAALLSRGELRPYNWSTDVRGQNVLLVTVVAVTPLALLVDAERAKKLGAATIYACGVDVQGTEALGSSLIDTYWPLVAPDEFASAPLLRSVGVWPPA